MPLISIIAAVADNGVIGNQGQLPWRLKNDLRHFKALTMGKPLIMGRKTYESIGKALEGRKTIILTRDPSWVPFEPVTVVHTMDEALAAANVRNLRSRPKRPVPEIMIVGGAQVYAEFMPLVKRMYLTWVHALPEGDTVFPSFDPNDYREMHREAHQADVDNEYPYTYLTLQRKTSIRT